MLKSSQEKGWILYMSEKANVYFSKEISPEKVLEMYQLLGKKLDGKVAIKLHSGEAGNQNFLKPEFWKPVIDYVGGTVVECNTAYEGERNTTAKHKKTLEAHGWSRYFKVDLLDAEGPDLELAIPNGKVIQKNFVGKDLADYDSLLVLSHFKGHPMGGYGGALKQLSIGIASSAGKAYIHGAGKPEDIWTADHDSFLESMADAASSVKDMGILISTDPIAIDQACLDLVYASDDPGRDHLLERIESRHGVHTIEAAAALGFGTREYELITVA